MKLQIDTDAKTIKIEGQVSVKEFYDKVQKLLPEDWESYKLETNTTIVNWGSPIYVTPHRPWVRPYWGTGDFIYSQQNSVNASNNLLRGNSGQSETVYNIEC